MPREYDFFVYFLTNRRNEVLYIGVTNDLLRRLAEHAAGTGCHFTRQYNVTKLVFYEHFGDAEEAIAREKQLKGWTRAKKEKLIATLNPAWEDLGEQLDPAYKGPRIGLATPYAPINPPKVQKPGKAAGEMGGPSTPLVPRCAQDDKTRGGDAFLVKRLTPTPRAGQHPPRAAASPPRRFSSERRGVFLRTNAVFLRGDAVSSRRDTISPRGNANCFEGTANAFEGTAVFSRANGNSPRENAGST